MNTLSRPVGVVTVGFLGLFRRVTQATLEVFLSARDDVTPLAGDTESTVRKTNPSSDCPEPPQPAATTSRTAGSRPRGHRTRTGGRETEAPSAAIRASSGGRCRCRLESWGREEHGGALGLRSQDRRVAPEAPFEIGSLAPELSDELLRLGRVADHPRGDHEQELGPHDCVNVDAEQEPD